MRDERLKRFEDDFDVGGGRRTDVVGGGGGGFGSQHGSRRVRVDAAFSGVNFLTLLAQITIHADRVRRGIEAEQGEFFPGGLDAKDRSSLRTMFKRTMRKIEYSKPS